jgi:hypothetical protein
MMIKHFLSFAAAVSLSFDASAGYIQYNLSGPGLSGPDPGILVIREEDKSVAFFSIHTQVGHFAPHDQGEYYHQNHILQATTSFRGLGPTNVVMRDVMQEEHTNFMWLTFSRGNGPKSFDYSMRLVSEPGPYAPYPDQHPLRDFTTTGTAVEVELSPFLAAGLDWMLENQLDLPRLVPGYVGVPEPASMALMMIGALGVINAGRRRKAQI